MKPTTKVSISGISFTIDDDAFLRLDSYLSTLTKSYENDPDGVEIMSDIEARIAEIILSLQNTETIVTYYVVNKIIDQLGSPEEVVATQPEITPENRPENRPKAEPAEETGDFPRRLYRDPEGAKVGGVCNGIATFFNIDAVWVRLGIFAPLFLVILSGVFDWEFISDVLGSLFGMFILLYFVLWFAIPLAKTPRQRLEMRGQRITATSIHNNMKSDRSAISGDPQKSGRWAILLSELLYVGGRIALFAVKFVAIFIGFLFAITTAALLGVTIAFILGKGDAAVSGMLFNLSIGGMSTHLFLGLLSLTALIPIAVLTFLIIRLAFNLPANRTFILIVLGLWLVLTGYMGSIVAKNFANIKHTMELIDDRYEDDIYNIQVDEDDRSVVITSSVIEGDSTKSDSVSVKLEISAPAKQK